MAQCLRGHPGQLRGGFSIAPAADRVEDDRGAVICQLCLPATAPALAGQLDCWQILSSDSWALLCWPAWPSNSSTSHSVHLPSLSGRKLFSQCTSVRMTARPTHQVYSLHVVSWRPMGCLVVYWNGFSSRCLPKDAGHAGHSGACLQNGEPCTEIDTAADAEREGRWPKCSYLILGPARIEGVSARTGRVFLRAACNPDLMARLRFMHRNSPWSAVSLTSD